MTINLEDIHADQIANRAFVPLAAEAGLSAVIKAMVVLARNEKALLIALKYALYDTNPELAEALNLHTLRAYIKYMQISNQGVSMAANLPETLDEDGPVSLAVSRNNPEGNIVLVTFSEPPPGYTYEIYYDGVFRKAGNNVATAGFVNDSFIALFDAHLHTVRVLFVTPDGELTRFGPVQEV